VRTYFDRSRLTLAAARAHLSVVADDLLEQAAEIRRQWAKLADTLRAAGSDEVGEKAEETASARRASSARLAAVDMAQDGASREDVEAFLRDELAIEDPEDILDEVFREPETEPSSPAALDEHAAALEAKRLGRIFARNRS